LKPVVCPDCGSPNIDTAVIDVNAVCAGVFGPNGEKDENFAPPPVAFTLEGWECSECLSHGFDKAEMKKRIEEEAAKAFRRQIAEMN
jgi:hypothetical protein